MAKRKRQILIVDSNDFFIESLKEDPKVEIVQPAFATEGAEMNGHLMDTTISFMGVFVNPMLSVQFDISLIRACHQYRPSTPIFVIYDQPPPLSDAELNSIGVQGSYKKPLTYSEMIDIVDPPLFDADAALTLAKGAEESVGQEIAATDSDFKSIRAKEFISGAKSFFDVYVQLKSGRYIKVLAAGDDFSRDRIQGYLEKGVEYFYIRSEAQEHYVAYCDKLAASLLKNEKISDSIKVKMISNHGEETISFLKQNGVSETNLHHASRFVSNISDVVEKMQMKKANIVKEFLSNILLLEHGNSTAMIASLLLKPLAITDKQLKEVVGFACIFHDIGLQGQPDVFQEENIEAMTEEQLALYHLHPIKGAEIMADVPNVEPAVIQAIEQHHERRGRMGFPKQLSAGSINTISEIVGLSDEFVRLVKLASKNKEVKVSHKLNQEIFPLFSYKIVDAFNEGVFGIKPKGY